MFGPRSSGSVKYSSAASMMVSYGFLPAGPGPHRCLSLSVRSSELPQHHAEVRLLEDGRLAQRSELFPFLKAAREHASGDAERLVAEALLKSAADEQSQWLPLVHEYKDVGAAPDAKHEDALASSLAELSSNILSQHIQRLEAWLASSRDVKLMVALGPAEPIDIDAIPTDSDSDQSSDDG
eukprot:TRINITY_DN22683_c0_g1_i1.p2 TRINITY_DN22683_c0_g1~~TRINITY_DN22683_c0_g1_i1.p2  ORF type:complete len:181 (+),score=20.59 TRINITY_DN22683_c0_g1_i1:891-1433(+)